MVRLPRPSEVGIGLSIKKPQFWIEKVLSWIENAGPWIEKARTWIEKLRSSIVKSLPWFAFSAVVIVLDQISKAVAVDMLSFTPTPILPFLSLTLACNTGAAFSILEGYGEVLAVLGILMAGFFIYSITRLPEDRRIEGFAFSLILAGAIGNVIDRLMRGCVVDFVHLHHGGWSFPIFNLADSAITIGAGLWILTLLLGRENANDRQTGQNRLDGT